MGQKCVWTINFEQLCGLLVRTNVGKKEWTNVDQNLGGQIGS